MDERLAYLLEATADLSPGSPPAISGSSESDFQARWPAEWPDVEGQDVTDVFDEIHESERATIARVSGSLRELAGSLDSRHVEQPWTEDERAAGESIIRRLALPVLVDVVHTVDFLLELRNRGELLNQFPNVLYFLISVSGHEALDRENHGMGFHFHYVSTSGRWPARTNVLLTFDPKEKGPPDTLYWEYHASHSLRAEPWRWGKRRSRAVYDAARPSLFKPGKDYFRAPSRGAAALYPQ